MSHFAHSFSTGGTKTGILTGFSGGISGGRSSSASAVTGTDFAEAILTSADFGGLQATVSENETGAATAGFEVTLKAAGAAADFEVAGNGCFCSGGVGLASSTVCLGLGSTVFSVTVMTLLSTEADANASRFLAFPCLPALTTLGAEQLA